MSSLSSTASPAASPAAAVAASPAASLTLVVGIENTSKRFATVMWGVSEPLEKLVNRCADQGLRLMVAPFSQQENKMMPPRAVHKEDTPKTAGLLHVGTNFFVQAVEA